MIDFEKLFINADAKHPVDKRLNHDEVMEILKLESRRIAEEEASVGLDDAY
jgi:hypothetical protein